MTSWYPPLDPDDLINGSYRMDESKVSGILDGLFTNNENYQGLFPVYGDLVPYGQNRAHSRDRKRSWHGGIDLMYPLNTHVFPVSEGVVVMAQDAGSNGDSNNHVVIRHLVEGKNVYSLYTHLNQNSIPIAVKNLVGTTTLVNPVQYIGKIGDSGSTNVHLHMELFSKDKIEIKDYFGDSENSAFELNPKRFRVTYFDNGTIADKTWSGTVYPQGTEVMVDQDYPDWDALFQNNKAAFRKWMVKHKTVWAGINNVTDIPSDRICWHYHPVQFILAMQNLKNRYSLPINLGFGLDVTSASLNKYYAHIEKEFPGGYYPIGGNTVWHGGVHIKPAKDTEVFAAFPGTVIAAQLPDDSSLAIKHYGSRNFILLKHTANGMPFYSLYMHLKNLKLDAGDSIIKKIAWIKNGNLNDNLAALKKSEVVKFGIPVNAGELLWISGEFGSPSKRAKMIHWELFSENNLLQDQVPEEITLPAELEGADGWGQLPATERNLRVERAAASRTKACHGETVTFKVVKCNYKDAPASEQNKINWKIVTTDNTFTEIKENVGLTMQFTVPEALKGKTIKAHPYKKSPASSVFAQVAVLAEDKKEWLIVEDNDDNYNVDCRKIVELFPTSMIKDNNLTTKELVKFYRDNPAGNAEKLRNAVCKFTSEWGIPDLDAAIAALKNRGFWMPNPKDKLACYMWWKNAKDRGVDLPSSPNVWHYHPVRFLAEMAGIKV